MLRGTRYSHVSRKATVSCGLKNTYHALPGDILWIYICFRTRDLLSSRRTTSHPTSLLHTRPSPSCQILTFQCRGRMRAYALSSLSRFLISLSLDMNISKSRLAERNEISSRIGAHIECKKIARARKYLFPESEFFPLYSNVRHDGDIIVFASGPGYR